MSTERLDVAHALLTKPNELDFTTQKAPCGIATILSVASTHGAFDPTMFWLPDLDSNQGPAD